MTQNETFVCLETKEEKNRRKTRMHGRTRQYLLKKFSFTSISFFFVFCVCVCVSVLQWIFLFSIDNSICCCAFLSFCSQFFFDRFSIYLFCHWAESPNVIYKKEVHKCVHWAKKMKKKKEEEKKMRTNSPPNSIVTRFSTTVMTLPIENFPMMRFSWK